MNRSPKTKNRCAQFYRPSYGVRKAMLRHLPGESLTMLKSIAVRSQQEVATALGISQQAVQQAERVALWKIRRALSEVWRENHFARRKSLSLNAPHKPSGEKPTK